MRELNRLVIDNSGSLGPLIGVQMTGQNLISLIGRDVLRHCVLVYNGPMGSYTIAF